MNNNVYILEDRAILYVNGPDAKDFLSNDINKVKDDLIFLYEFIISKHKQGYFVDCEKSQRSF